MPSSPDFLYSIVSTSFAESSSALEQVQHHAGVERAGARSHAQPVERREAERAIDALAVLERAEARTAAEVRDDHAAGCDLGSDARQGARDVFVRDAVKSVALHAGAANLGG
jgi:hypothetical protein